jgi:hypothetical protein
LAKKFLKSAQDTGLATRRVWPLISSSLKWSTRGRHNDQVDTVAQFLDWTFRSLLALIAPKQPLLA